jgi:hypothetical protein
MDIIFTATRSKSNDLQAEHRDAEIAAVDLDGEAQASARNGRDNFILVICEQPAPPVY